MIMLSSTCNICTGRTAITEEARQQQLYYSYVETMIAYGFGSRQQLSMRYELSQDDFEAIVEEKIRKGFPVTYQEAAGIGYARRVAEMRKLIAKHIKRGVPMKREAQRSPGRKRGDSADWLHSEVRKKRVRPSRSKAAIEARAGLPPKRRGRPRKKDLE